MKEYTYYVKLSTYISVTANNTEEANEKIDELLNNSCLSAYDAKNYDVEITDVELSEVEYL